MHASCAPCRSGAADAMDHRADPVRRGCRSRRGCPRSTDVSGPSKVLLAGPKLLVTVAQQRPNRGRTKSCGSLDGALRLVRPCCRWPGRAQAQPAGPVDAGKVSRDIRQQAAGKKWQIATVVKVDGIAWFDRMRAGIEQFGRDTGHDAWMVGPSQADAAAQVQLIENLIGQGVDAICVVPFSVEAVEPVLKKARERGIVVVAHEASNLVNADYVIEAFDNRAYGAKLMEELGAVDRRRGEVRRHRRQPDESVAQGVGGRRGRLPEGALSQDAGGGQPGRKLRRRRDRLYQAEGGADRASRPARHHRRADAGQRRGRAADRGDRHQGQAAGSAAPGWCRSPGNT